MEKKKWLMRLALVFFLCMLLFTMLSRAADSLKVAQVYAETPREKKLDHSITSTGIVRENRELPVCTEPGKRVQTIHVKEGEEVKAGELLLEMDLEFLKEQMEEQERELSKLRMQAADYAGSAAQKAQEKAREEARAQEDLEEARKRGQEQVDGAKEELEKARKELEDFLRSQKKERKKRRKTGSIHLPKEMQSVRRTRTVPGSRIVPIRPIAQKVQTAQIV